MTAIGDILIAFLEEQGITRARAEELIAKDPSNIAETLNQQLTAAQTALLQASLVPDA